MKHPLVRMAGVSCLFLSAVVAPASAEAPFSTSPVSVADTNVAPDSQPQLVAVRVGQQDGFDRVVFEFDKHVPGYQVRFVDQVVADGSAAPVAVAGSAFISVAFSSVASAQAGAPPAPQSRQSPNFSELLEVVGTGDFEGVVSYGLGLRTTGEFRVSELTGPDRVVIDVRSDTLPATGSGDRSLAIGGCMLLALGLLLVRTSRRLSLARSVEGR